MRTLRIFWEYLSLNPELHLIAGSAPSHTHMQTTPCRSCGAKVDGNFCANCAEPRVAHMPSAAEFLHEFVGHFIALEGKLWKTLKLLLLQPGRLTLDYLAGRRVAYIPPLRLYLTLSVLFFALIRWCDISLPQLTIDKLHLGMGYHRSVKVDVPDALSKHDAKPRTIGDANAPGLSLTYSPTANGDRDQVAKPEHATPAAPPPQKPTESTQPSAANRVIFAAVDAINPAWSANLTHFIGLPDDVKSEMLNHGFIAYLPYMLIGALPLFALYLKLLYIRSGKYYGEHLLFALHTNAFAFFIASVMIALPGSLSWLMLSLALRNYSAISAWDCLQWLPFLYLLTYLPMAMRRVYGGSHASTALRWLVLITVHMSVVVIATVLAELIGIVGHG